MSAYQITNKLINVIKYRNFNFICVNYANADMVGHSGKLQPTIKACNTVDNCIGTLLHICREQNIELLITADHGNAEEMYCIDSHQVKKSHTINNVPFIYFGKRNINLLNGKLSDIAPTILDLMQIPKPIEMTGNTLIHMYKKDYHKS